MNKFASDAISKERVTMKPNLRPGPFLNGRSSAGAQPTDLDFYHVDYLVDCPKAKPEGSLPRKTRKSNNQRRAERALQEDSNFFANIRTDARRTSRLSGPAPQPGTRLSAPAGIGSDGTDSPISEGLGNGRPASRAAADLGFGARCRRTSMQQAGEKDGRASAPALSNSRLSSLASGGTSLQPHGQDTGSLALPGYAPNDSHLDGLLASGVYDHTGISHDRISASHSAPLREEQPRSRDDNSKPPRACAPFSARRDSYQDKGTMVSPWLENESRFTPLNSRARTCGPIDIGHGNSVEASRYIQTTPMEGTEQSQAFKSQERTSTVQSRPDANGDSQTAEIPELPGTRVYNSTPAGLENTHQYGGCDANENPPEDSLATGPGNHDFFKFPGNRPSVQPLRYGVSMPQIPDGPWTHPGMASLYAPHSMAPKPAQRLDADVGRGRAHELERRRSSEMMDGDAGKHIPDFIARLEREAREEVEMSMHLDQDVEWFQRGGGMLDREMVDLQLHQFDVADSTARGGEFGQPRDRRRAPGSLTVHGPHVTGRRPWQQRHGSGDMDMAGFWRPNCFR